MANLYWVGGTANWDGTAGTKWATTSGGAGGAAVPTSADDVFLDANSGAVTVSIVTGNTGAKSLNCTGFTGTLAGNAGLTLSGSLTLSSTMTLTYAATFVFNGATQTLTSAGKIFAAGSGVVLSGSASATLDLADALNIPLNVGLSGGTIRTNGYSVTAAGLSATGATTKVMDISTSTITLTGTTLLNYTGTGATLTGTAGSGVIKTTSASAKTFDSGTNTVNNITLDQAGSGALTIAGSNNFYDVTNSYSATGATTIKFTSGTTTTLTQFTATGALGKVLTLGASTTAQATLQKGSTWYMGANSTDGGNNTGLTFTAGGGIDYLSVSFINGTVVSTGSTSNFFMLF